jgi:putative peptide zinc metalloprotease protein
LVLLSTFRAAAFGSRPTSEALMLDQRQEIVSVYPFTRQPSGDEVIIGRPDTGVFVSLPVEAVEILDMLSNGYSVEKAESEFEARYGERPDVTNLLQGLESRGLIAWPNAGQNADLQPGANPSTVRYHFASIRQAVAQRFFGPAAFFLYALLIGSAFIVVVTNVSIMPGRNSLFFHDHRTAKLLAITAIGCVSVFVHEFFHLLGARAVGIKSRIGISHRLWVLVAETDLSGLWAVPPRGRYLPILAGPLSDCVVGASIVLLLFAQSQGFMQVSSGLIEVTRAMLFMYLLRLLWQCFFFVRTDLYYIIINFFGCKNLMSDTQVFLKNLIARRLGRPLVDQSHIPEKEQRVIRAYSVLWILGRGLAFVSLFFVSLPLLFRYFSAAWEAIRDRHIYTRFQVVDALAMTVIAVAPLVIGLMLWIKSLIRRRAV